MQVGEKNNLRGKDTKGCIIWWQKKGCIVWRPEAWAPLLSHASIYWDSCAVQAFPVDTGIVFNVFLGLFSS